jgi:hypothetical protein
MSDDIVEALSAAIDREKIIAINATVIPSPSHANAYPGNHLLINCVYQAPVASQDASRVLAVARADTVAILRCLVAENALRGIESVCVTFIAPTSDYSPRRRLYRYSVLSSAIRTVPESIDDDFLISNRLFLQESEVPDICELLEREPRRETHLKKELWSE